MPSIQSNKPEDAARQVVLDKALSDNTKRCGDGSIMRLSESHQLMVASIITGDLKKNVVSKGRKPDRTACMLQDSFQELLIGEF